MERYKAIPEFPNYEVCDKGFVRNVKSGKILKGSPAGNNGTIRVSLRGKDKIVQCTLARLVADAFVGNNDPYEFDLVGHFDGNINNNDSSNLFWTNSKGILGQMHTTIKIKNRKRSSDQEVIVYNLRSDDMFEFPKMIEAAKFIGCSYTTVKKIIDTNSDFKGWMIERR